MQSQRHHDIGFISVSYYILISDVEFVMEHMPLELEGRKVNVKWCEINDAANTSETCAVDVQGPPSLIAIDKADVLKQFFQNESKSKSDIILNFAEAGKANIVFESKEGE